MNKKILGMFALMVVLVASVGTVFAYKGDYTTNGPDYTAERHDAMEEAFETSDYDTWYELMAESGRNPRVVDVVTEENFETFVQAHDAGKAGDYETAAALRAELGLNNGVGPKDGAGRMMGQGQGQGQGKGQGKGRA